MTDTPKNIVVIGGGHNGLVCAAYLAKAGKKVTVLEAADHVGRRSHHPRIRAGFQVSAGAHLLYLLDEGISQGSGAWLRMACTMAKSGTWTPFRSGRCR